MSQDINLTTITLEAKKFGAVHHVSRMVLDSIDIDEAMSMFAEDLVLTLRAYVYGKSGSSQAHIERQHPANWWQRFKLQAIKDGNPFFRSDRVRWTTERINIEGDLFSWWPDLDVQMPPSAGQPVRLITHAREVQ